MVIACACGCDVVVVLFLLLLWLLLVLVVVMLLLLLFLLLLAPWLRRSTCDQKVIGSIPARIEKRLLTSYVES